MHRDVHADGARAEVELGLERPVQHPGDEADHGSPVSLLFSTPVRRLVGPQRVKLLHALEDACAERVDGLLQVRDGERAERRGGQAES